MNIFVMFLYKYVPQVSLPT